MLAALPNDIDKSEPSIPWDFTRPAAIEKAEFVQFELNETVKLMFPHWAYNEWLDLHAQLEGIARRPSNRASGHVKAIGKPGLVVAKGYQFATLANLTSSVIFETTEEATLGNGDYTIMDAGVPPTAVMRLALKAPSQRPLRVTIRPTTDDPDAGELLLLDGATVLEQFAFDASEGIDQVTALMDAVTAQGSTYFTLAKLADSAAKPLAHVAEKTIGTAIPIQAVLGGRIGNVPPDSIILMVKPEAGISYIANSEATTGGAPEESDDELRERVLDAIRYGVSWTGCDADYVRWARAVPGVGHAVTEPEWNDPSLPEEFHWVDAEGVRHCAGAVRLFVIDSNGLPANQQILDAVYESIIHPEDRMQRKAPIGATLTVAAPVPLYVDITARVILKDGETLDTVTKRFKENLNKYWLEASTENDMYNVYTGAARNYVKYVYIGAILAETAGMADYDHETLLVNDDTENVLINFGTFPVTGVVDLYE
jgi:uncharacterized phage protein gp47/JayE